MDLTRILQQLYAERERLQKAIAILEQMMQENPESRGVEFKAVGRRIKKNSPKKRDPEAPEDPANAESSCDHPDCKP